MFHFNREPGAPKAEQDPLLKRITEAEELLKGKVSIALNRLESSDSGKAKKEAIEDETAYAHGDRLNAIRNAYEELKLKANILGGTTGVAALTAVIYGLTKYPESKELAEQISAMGVVSGGLGYYAVLIWRVLAQNGLAKEVAEIAKRYE